MTLKCSDTSWQFQNNSTPNSDGLINWLRQPGLIRYQPQKSMRVNFQQLIKSCGTRTVPAAKTKSIGLPADAHGVMVFAISSWQLYRDQTTFVHLSGLGTILTVTSWPMTFQPSTGTCKNHATATLTPTQLNRRAVRLQ